MLVSHSCRDGHTGEELTGANSIYKELKMKVEQVDLKMKKRRKSGLSNIPMRSALGMVGWNPFSSVMETLEYYHFDFENGVSPKSLNAEVFSVTGEGKDVVITDKRGYAHVLEHLSKPFKNKVSSSVNCERRIIVNSVAAELSISLFD